MDSARTSSPPRPLGSRALTRLRIAATLMRWPLSAATDDDFARRVLETIGRLDGRRRERLRGLVDWVEAYEQAEQAERVRSARPVPSSSRRAPCLHSSSSPRP